MKLDDIVRGRGGEWTPEPPPNPSYLPDFRYTGIQSCFEVDGDVLAQLHQHHYATVEAHKPRTPVAWDRVLWDEPWEPPKPKKPETRPPLVVAHSFDALTGVARDAQGHDLIHMMGMSLHRVVHEVASPEDRDEFDSAWTSFSSNSALSRFSPSAQRGLIEYAMDVEQVMQAAMEVRASWYDFLDVAVTTAQRGMKLKMAPVFVFLFMDFQFEPGAAERLSRAMRKMSHPRLLCLFASEP